MGAQGWEKLSVVKSTSRGKERGSVVGGGAAPTNGTVEGITTDPGRAHKAPLAHQPQQSPLADRDEAMAFVGGVGRKWEEVESQNLEHPILPTMPVETLRKIIAKAVADQSGKLKAVDSPLLTLREAMRYCRVGKEVFNKHVRPYLRTKRIGGREFFFQDDVDAWLRDDETGEHSDALINGGKIRRRGYCTSGSDTTGSEKQSQLEQEILSSLKR